MSNTPIAQIAASTIKGTEKQDIYPKTIDAAVITTDVDGNETTLDRVLIKDIEVNGVSVTPEEGVVGIDAPIIESIDAEESQEDGGTNVITITMTNDDEYSFNIKNGSKGSSGATGATGKSAYQSYVDTTSDNPPKSEQAWVASLKGADGTQGPTGPTGPQGPKGNSGYSGAAGELEVVNNLEDGGDEAALSASMGKELKSMIDNIEGSLYSGSYAQALNYAMNKTNIFEFLLVDEVNNSNLIKPLWYINGLFVDAAGAVVSLATLTAPTFSIDSGDVTAGTTVTITCPSGSTLYYSVNGVSDTDTSDVTITINEASVIKAYLKSGDAVSDIVAKSYGIAVDHKFQFKIALTGNNSTEYVPVVSSGDPRYTMTVDWGDGSTPSTYSNQGFSNKGCGHTYTGSAGDEFTITLRGSAIPYLAFSASTQCNVGALVAILDNTLECQTNFSNVDSSGTLGFKNCTNLASMSANALSNSVTSQISFRGCTALTSLPTGFFANLHNLTSANGMFYDSVLVFTNDNLDELKVAIKNATDLSYLFYSFDGTLAIPDDFFDEVTATVASVANMFNSVTSSNVSGDAKALYDVLVTKVGSGATTNNCFSSTRLSNRNQVPSAWGGTGS